MAKSKSKHRVTIRSITKIFRQRVKKIILSKDKTVPDHTVQRKRSKFERQYKLLISHLYLLIIRN
jgi:hypothetical protein